jgi:hypothetical protein
VFTKAHYLTPMCGILYIWEYFQETNLIKSSRAINRVNLLKITDVSGTISATIITIQTVPSGLDDADRDVLRNVGKFLTT